MSNTSSSHRSPPFQTNNSHMSNETVVSTSVDENGVQVTNLAPHRRQISGVSSVPPGAMSMRMPAAIYRPDLDRSQGDSVSGNNDERLYTPPGSPSQRLLEADPNHIQFAAYQDEKRGQYTSVPIVVENSEFSWIPLPLRPWFWVPLVVILAGGAVGLEIALFFSNKNQGWPTTRDIGTETGILHYVYTLPPVAVASIFVALWAWTDIEIKKMQPYVDLVHGDSPPHRSLLLDYTRTNNFIVWTRAATNKHYLVALASLMVVLSLAFQPLAASLLVVKDTWLPQPDVTKQSLSAIGLNQNLQFEDLTSFVTASGYAAATVLYNLTTAPFIHGPYTVAPFQLPTEIATNGTVSANTTALKNDPGCLSVQPVLNQHPDGSGWNNSATTSDQSCSFSWSVDKSATTLFGTDVANCTQDQDIWFRPIIFWFFTYQPSARGSATFCYPSFTLWDVNVNVDLASGNISQVTELRPFNSSSSNFSEFSGTVTGPPLNGQAYNGIRFNLTNVTDPFVLAREAAIQLQLPAAIYQEALSTSGGLVEAFVAGNFVPLSNRIYSLYLALIAKEIYFLPTSDPLTVQVKTFKKRVWLSDTAVHLLATAMLMLAFFATIIHLFHRFDRRSLRLKHEPGTIASAVSIGAQTGVGNVLAGRQAAKEISEALRNKKFRIDPQTMKIVMEGETGYDYAASPVERRRSVFASFQGQKSN